MIAVICFAITIAIGILTFFAYFYKINWVQQLPKGTKSIKAKNQKISQLPPVYPNGWFGLLESSELKKGEVKHVVAIGQNFAIFRTETGIARVMNAYCPHLGANMAEGGAVRGEELECHFHSWRFCGETGKCTSIPYTKATIPSLLKAKVWDSTEVNGMIFVWYHAESAAPDWYPKQHKDITNGTYKYQGRNEFFIHSHIQDIAENGSDWAHLDAIHTASMINVGFMARIMRHEWTNVTWTSPVENLFDDDIETSGKHNAVIQLHHSVILFNKFSILELDVKGLQKGPGYVEIYLQTAVGPVFIIENVTPVGPLLQRVTHLMYAPMHTAPYCKIILIGESLMFYRDVVVWNYKRFENNPILVNEDKNIKKYRRWYQQFYTENSPTYESCKDSLDW